MLVRARTARQSPQLRQGGGAQLHHLLGPLRAGNCGYGYLDPHAGTGWDIAAISDKMAGFDGSCGKCFEVRCRPASFTDGNGAELHREDACYDPTKSIVVTITDSCPCYKPGNEASNKRWCCGDMPHFDLSQWAFEKLASKVTWEPPGMCRVLAGSTGRHSRAPPCSPAAGQGRDRHRVPPRGLRLPPRRPGGRPAGRREPRRRQHERQQKALQLRWARREAVRRQEPRPTGPGVQRQSRGARASGLEQQAGQAPPALHRALRERVARST